MRGRLRKCAPLFLLLFSLISSSANDRQATYESRCSATIEYGYRKGEIRREWGKFTRERRDCVTDRLAVLVAAALKVSKISTEFNFPVQRLTLTNSVHWSENAFFPREFVNPLAKHTQLHNSLHKQQNKIAGSGHLLCCNANTSPHVAVF